MTLTERKTKKLSDMEHLNAIFNHEKLFFFQVLLKIPKQRTILYKMIYHMLGCDKMVYDFGILALYIKPTVVDDQVFQLHFQWNQTTVSATFLSNVYINVLP